jgi:hypothetical protein
MSGNSAAEAEYWKRRNNELRAELMVRNAEIVNLTKKLEIEVVKNAFLKAANAGKDAKIAQLTNYIAKAVPPSVGGTPLEQAPDYYY